MPTYELLDAEQNAKLFPSNFHIPPHWERDNVPDNFWVKIGFKCPKETGVDYEYLGVQIENRESPNGLYYGKLGDQPKYAKGIKINDSIQFERHNIIQIAMPDSR
jgi:hypothetical protein